MNISKTTFNYAERRGLELTVNHYEDCVLLCVWEKENDCEWMFSYRIEFDKLVWNGNIYLPESIKEELPATIFDEKQLRRVLGFVSEEMK